MALSSDTAYNSERSWVRELWCCKYTNTCTVARHELDPSLAGTLQHRWKRNKMNVKSEANWSVFRHDFAPGYEDLFESGVNAGYYNVDNVLEK
jgi:hypothetical protein